MDMELVAKAFVEENVTNLRSWIGEEWEAIQTNDEAPPSNGKVTHL